MALTLAALAVATVAAVGFAIRRRFARRIAARVDALGDASVVHVRQRGEIRLREDGAWLPFDADCWYSVERCAFVWDARVRMSSLVRVRVVDALDRGGAILEARVFGVIPVASARGPEIAIGELQRYLAELPWCPEAWSRNPELHVDRTGPCTSCIRARSAGVEASVELRLDDAGDVVGGTALRPRTIGGETAAMPWAFEFSDRRSFDGVLVPVRGEVRWITSDGPFPYFRADVVVVERLDAAT